MAHNSWWECIESLGWQLTLVTIDTGDPTQPNQTAHEPAAHYRAVQHPIARWWTAGLIAGWLSLILKSMEPMLSHKFIHLFAPFIT